MRGFLLRLFVGLLTLVIGLGAAALFGAKLMPHFPRPFHHRHYQVPPPPIDDALWRESYHGCPGRFHNRANVIQLHLDAMPAPDADFDAKAHAITPVAPRSR